VDEGHRTDRRADVAWACRRFIDLTTVDFNLDGVVAGEATEEGDLHIWNDGSRPDDQTLDTNEFIRI